MWGFLRHVFGVLAPLDETCALLFPDWREVSIAHSSEILRAVVNPTMLVSFEVPRSPKDLLALFLPMPPLAHSPGYVVFGSLSRRTNLSSPYDLEGFVHARLSEEQKTTYKAY